MRPNGASAIRRYTFISIHAPAKGATGSNESVDIKFRYFNPRTREGCDFAVAYATGMFNNFNPRTREGCDPSGSSTLKIFLNFNPRTREGCDVTMTEVWKYR